MGHISPSPVAEDRICLHWHNMNIEALMIKVNRAIMCLIGRTAQGIFRQDDSVSKIHRSQDSGQHAYIRFPTGYNECINRVFLQMMMKFGVEPG